MKESNSCWDMVDWWQWNATFNSTHIALNLLFAGSISWRVSPRGAIFVHGRLRLGAKLACSHAKVFGHLRRQLYHPIFSPLHLRCRVWLVLSIMIVARMNNTQYLRETAYSERVQKLQMRYSPPHNQLSKFSKLTNTLQRGTFDRNSL